MLMLAGLLLVVCRVGAEFLVQCSGKDEASVSVEAMPTPARYNVTYCAASEPTPLRWELVLSAVDEPAEQCSYQQLLENRAGTSHSSSVETIEPSLKFSCPFVCFSKSMDLMFRGCYRLENKLQRQGPRKPINSEPYNTYYYADNNVTRYTQDHLQYFQCTDYDDKVVCNWFEGLIPITDYEVSIWPNSTHFMDEPTIVTGNCTRVESPGRAVQCVLAVSPGCYVLQLRHTAPWTKGFAHLAVHNADMCYNPSPPATLRPPTDAGLYWLAGGVAALGAALLGALTVFHRRLQAKNQLRVVNQWLQRRPQPPAPEQTQGPVLLLYARDCARVAAALRDWMQDIAPGKIYDVYSAEVTAIAAPASAAWVRGCITTPDVRVVLVQSPALAALHATTLGDNTDKLQLESPLLPSRAVYRRPHYGDTLLQYAAQLLGETAHIAPAPPYLKYCLATISELPVDVFPALVPYTRFSLPEAAPALVRSLWPGAGALATSADHLEAVTNATDEFVQHVREHPNYLADELIFM